MSKKQISVKEKKKGIYSTPVNLALNEKPSLLFHSPYIRKLTSSTEFEFRRGLRALLIVSNEALVHPLVLLLHALDPQHSLLQSKRFPILEPRDGLDRIPSHVASEGSRSAEVDGLRARLDLRTQRRRHRQHRLHALPAHRVVHDAKILSRILDTRLPDDQCSANLADALVQLDRLAAGRALDELVPSETRHGARRSRHLRFGRPHFFFLEFLERKKSFPSFLPSFGWKRTERIETDVRHEDEFK